MRCWAGSQLRTQRRRARCAPEVQPGRLATGRQQFAGGCRVMPRDPLVPSTCFSRPPCHRTESLPSSCSRRSWPAAWDRRRTLSSASNAAAAAPRPWHPAAHRQPPAADAATAAAPAAAAAASAAPAAAPPAWRPAATPRQQGAAAAWWFTICRSTSAPKRLRGSSSSECKPPNVQGFPWPTLPQRCCSTGSAAQRCGLRRRTLAVEQP